MLFVFGIAAALAADVQLTHQGRLLDAEGNPTNASLSLTFTLWTAQTGGDDVWTETDTVFVQQGVYSTTLGDQLPLAASVIDQGMWLEISPTSGPPFPGRQRVNEVPTAAAAHTLLGSSTVRVGDDTGGSACTEDWYGHLRYLEGRMEACTPSNPLWVPVTFGEPVDTSAGATQANAVASCRAAYDVGVRVDGLRWIDPDQDGDTTNAFEAWCDMTNGGWTAVWGREDSPLLFTAAPYNGYSDYTVNQTTLSMDAYFSCAGTGNIQGIALTLSVPLEPTEMRVAGVEWTGVGSSSGDRCAADDRQPFNDGMYTDVDPENDPLDMVTGEVYEVPFGPDNVLYATCYCQYGASQRGAASGGAIWVR